MITYAGECVRNTVKTVQKALNYIVHGESYIGSGALDTAPEWVPKDTAPKPLPKDTAPEWQPGDAVVGGDAIDRMYADVNKMLKLELKRKFREVRERRGDTVEVLRRELHLRFGGHFYTSIAKYDTGDVNALMQLAEDFEEQGAAPAEIAARRMKGEDMLSVHRAQVLIGLEVLAKYRTACEAVEKKAVEKKYGYGVWELAHQNRVTQREA